MSNPEDLLTQEDCTKILRKLDNSDEITYKSHSITKLEGVEGLGGHHYRLKISYSRNNTEQVLNLFLKNVDLPSKVMDEMVVSIKAFEKEHFLYNILHEELKKLNLPTGFAPKSYLCRPRLFVMEDLSIAGYRTNPKKNMLDIRHCKVGLKTLAHFHATTMLYEELRRKDGAKDLDEEYPFLEDIFVSKTRNLGQQWLECTVKGLLELIELLPPSDISNESFKERVLEVLDEIKGAKVETNCKNTILHGDLWSNNFLFKYEGDRPVHSVLIDYQILKYGPVSIDVVQMILTNVRRSLREIHFEELLSYYYHEFVAYCEGLGYDASTLLNYKDFMATCEEVKIVTKLQCLADHSITFLMDESIMEYFQSEEGIWEFLFGDRSKSMVMSFKENDLYREVLSEDLEELREMVFKT